MRSLAGIAFTVAVSGSSALMLGGATANADTPVTFTVDSVVDEAAALPFSGQCVSTGGHCTVRAAVQAANARPGSTVVIPAGHYTLSIPPNAELTNGPLPDPTRGDLNVTAPTTIVGAGADSTILDANGVDRIFMITGDTTIRGLTATRGVAREHEIPFYDTGGGGILNSSHLVLDHVTLSNNTADFAGAIQNLPWSDMVMTDSLVTGNNSHETGGVRCDNTCRISGTTITDNHANRTDKWYLPASQNGRGGGLDLRGFADVYVDHTTITGNTATDMSGGIHIAPGYLDTLGNNSDPKMAHLYISNSTVTDNTVAGRVENCGSVFAAIVDKEGNKADDATCGFAK